jgi:hypothetical protein
LRSIVIGAKAENMGHGACGFVDLVLEDVAHLFRWFLFFSMREKNWLAANNRRVGREREISFFYSTYDL